MADEEPTVTGTRRRRVPYEWILGAMFVGTFFFREVEFFLARAIWLVVVGLAAGSALGVKPGTGGSQIRAGLPLATGAIGWLYFIVLIYVFHLADPFPPSDVRKAVLLAWPVGVAPCLVVVLAAATRPGRYREFSVFLNAAALLFFAFGFDAIWTPK